MKIKTDKIIKQITNQFPMGTNKKMSIWDSFIISVCDIEDYFWKVAGNKDKSSSFSRKVSSKLLLVICAGNKNAIKKKKN